VIRGVQLGRFQLGLTLARRGRYLVVAVLVGLQKRDPA
jgi:hypothetical protein